MRLKALVNGSETLVRGEDPIISDDTPGHLKILWPLKTIKGTLSIDLDERQAAFHLESPNSIDWYFDLTTSDSARLPFQKVLSDQVLCQFGAADYSVSIIDGSFSKPANGAVFRIKPKSNSLTLTFSRGH